MSEKIKNQGESTILGWVWALTEQFGARAISLIVGLILARLLSPSDFGLLASVSIFITIVQQIIDGGIAQRVIQKYEVGDEEYNALFFGNLAVSAALALALFFSAGPIADFFKVPELKEVVMFLGGWVFLSNAGRVQKTKLTRETQYRKLALISLAAAIFGSLVGVSMAFLDYGIWALLGQMFSMSLVTVLLLWWIEPWRPTMIPKWSSVVDLYAFGLPVLICQTIRSASNQMINVLTAKYYSPTLLGYYERGGLIPRTMMLSVGNVLTKVNFTSLSKLQKDPERLRVTFLSFFSVGIGATVMTLASMAVFTDEIVYVVLGEKWLASVWFFQMACLISITHVFFIMNVDLLKALGKTGVFFKGNMISAGVQILFVLCGLRWGISGMIIGDLCARVFAVTLMAFIVARNSSIQVKDQMAELIKALYWIIPLVVGLYSIKMGIDSLIARITSGVLVFTGMMWFWWRKQHHRVSPQPEL